MLCILTKQLLASQNKKSVHINKVKLSCVQFFKYVFAGLSKKETCLRGRGPSGRAAEINPFF